MSTINFLKMQGLGNDFVIIDGRKSPFTPEKSKIIRISNRKHGVGCDQFILLEPSKQADIFMRIYNPDGSEAGACGNATRCVADIIMTEKAKDEIVIETVSGLLPCKRFNNEMITVDMGIPKLDWQSIPLAKEQDTLQVDITLGPYSQPVAVNMGNPHTVFFVKDVKSEPIEIFGPQLETHPMFPQKANIEFVEVINRGVVRLRVWERGAGITQACGSGACAVAVASIRRGLTDRKVEVIMDGGSLYLEWREADNHVLMTGGYEYVFKGEFF